MFRSLLPSARVVAAAFAALAWYATPAQAQLVCGPLDSLESLYFLDISNLPTVVTSEILDLENTDIAADGIYGVAVDDANRTIYFNVGDAPLSELYSVHYDDPAMDFSGRLRPRKVCDLHFADSQIINGLAYDPATDTLYGVDDFQSTTGGGPLGIYEINRTTGETTLVVDLTVGGTSIWKMRGIDFNPADNLLYGVNLDSTPNGIGLFSIDVNGAGTISPVAALTGTNKTGLAIGGNKAYIFPDDPGDIEVYNLATLSFEAPITGVPWPTSELDNGAGWAPSYPVAGPVPGANFCTNLTADVSTLTDVQANVGQINYTVTNSNCGPDGAASGSYTIVLSGGAAATATISNIVSFTGTAVEGPTGTITGNLTPAPFASTETVTFTVTAGNPGDLTVTVDWNPDGGSTDPYLPNNTAAISHLVRVFPAAAAIASTVSGKSSAQVPGLGAEYDTGLGRAYRSPDGTRIAFEASTNFDAGTNDDVVVRYDNGVGTLLTQENNTLVTGAHLVDNTDERLGVNNDGFVSIAVDTTQSLDDDFIIYTDGTTLNIVCQEDQIVPNAAFQPNGWDYGSTQFSSSITGDNNVFFSVEFMGGGIPSGQDTAYFRSNPDGSAVTTVLWEGVSIPAGQAFGATEFWMDGDTDGQWVDGAGCNYIAMGNLTGDGNSDEVVIVNGTVVFQEGQTLTGTGLAGILPGSFGVSTTSGVRFVEMLSNGDWLARGITSVSDEDWAVKGKGATFSLLARNGDEIYPGANEFWSDVDGWSPTFRALAGNNQGDYVIMGRTTTADTQKNYVFVINGMAEVLREGDPVALDADGLFDDDAFINLPEEDGMILTDDGLLILTTSLRNAAGGSAGNAVVSVDVSTHISPQITGADLSVSKSASTDFIDNVGDQITYTITVCNIGPDDATSVIVTDILPDEVSFVSATMGAMEVLPGIVEANFGTIPAYTSTSFEIVVDTIAQGVAINTATANSSTTDPDTNNNAGSVQVTIQNHADVSVDIVDDGGAPVGQDFTYTITITNNGPAPATNVQMTDTLDPTTNFVSATNGAVEGPAGVVTRTFASIAPNASEVVEITVQGTLQSLTSNTVSVTANEVDVDLDNNSDTVETIVGDVSNLSVTFIDPGLQNVGEDFAYTVTVANGGPATATGVFVQATIPPGMNVVSLTNGAVENPPGSGNVEASFASIVSQASESIVITVNVPAEGTFNVSAQAFANEIDPDTIDNSAVAITRVGNFRDMSIIYSEIDGHPTAIVPGARDAVGDPVVTEWKSIDEFSVSPDGSMWAVGGFNELVDALNDSKVLGSGLVGDTFAQEGQQIPGEAPGVTYVLPMGTRIGFNSNNDFSFGSAGSAPVDEDLIFTVVNGVQTTVARESDSAMGLEDGNGPFFGALLGNSMGSEQLLDDGRTWFVASNLTVIGSAFDAAIMNQDIGGSTAFVQAGITLVSGEVLTDLDGSDSMKATPDGNTYALLGNVGADSTLTESLIVNGVVQIRAGTNVLGIDVVDVFAVDLATDGTWFARGDDIVDNDWAISNGVLYAQTGMSITGGAETWGNNIAGFTGNTNGDYVIVGNTSEPDENFNSVIALNGTNVVVREGDPIDLDGNGLFDDNVFIGRALNTTLPFTADAVHLTNGNLLYFIAALRDAEGNDLGTFGAGGQAFIVMDLSDLLGAECGTVLGDISGDSTVNGIDVQGFTDCALTLGAPAGACLCADFDEDADVDADDVDAFVSLLIAP